jgi:hypothetical protein
MIYRELKLNKKNSSGTGDLKPVALVDGTTNFIREANSGREPRSLTELLILLIPYLTTLTSVSGLRIGDAVSEYVVRLCYISLHHGDAAALSYDKQYRQRLSANANLLATNRNCGYSEAVVRCFLRNEDAELLAQAFSNSVKPSTQFKRPSEVCPYGPNCELLKKRICSFGPSKHVGFEKRENYTAKKGKGAPVGKWNNNNY